MGLELMAPGQTLPAPLPDDLHGYRGRTLYEDEEQTLATIPWAKAQAYLRALALTGKAGEAAEIAHTSASHASYWRAQSQIFSTLEGSIKEDILARVNDLAARKVENGFLERMFDGEGKLKGTRRREDPGFTRAWLGSIDPNWRNDDGKSQSITVQILQTHE